MEIRLDKIIILEKRARELEELLRPWKGMTIKDAREKGWKEEHDKLQSELWSIGYQLSQMKVGLRNID